MANPRTVLITWRTRTLSLAAGVVLTTLTGCGTDTANPPAAASAGSTSAGTTSAGDAVQAPANLPEGWTYTEGLVSMGGTLFIGNNPARHGDVAGQFRDAGVAAVVVDDQQSTADKIRAVASYLGVDDAGDELAAAGACVVVVLHDLNLAARYADRVAVFADGRLVADGSPRDVLTAERIAAVYRQQVTVLAHPGTGHPLVVPV